MRQNIKLFAALTLAIGLTAPRARAQCEVQEAFKLTASDAAAGDWFGLSVAIDGDTALVGASNDDNAGGTEAGSVYVFVRSGGVWTQQTKLTASDGASSKLFGAAVALSGDTAVVGSVFDFGGHGSAYVFVRSGGNWIEQAKLTASDGASNDHFGESVAISVNTVVVGAWHAGAPVGTDAGSAYVFVKPSGGWSNMTETAKFTPSDPAANDHFGISVAASGDTALVGAFGNWPTGEGRPGSAYVFVRNGENWTERAKLTVPDEAPDDWFGRSVAVSGDTALVGAYGDDHAGGANAGSAYVFVRSGDVWTKQASLRACDAAAEDVFGGFSVALFGDTAVISALYDDHAGGFDAGSAYVFVRSDDVWSARTKLTASDAAASDLFSNSVALSDDTVVVGAFYDDHVGGIDAGSAYVFDLNLPTAPDCNSNGIPDECELPPLSLCPTGYDCNANGIPDDCDIAYCTADPACADCNSNGIPDDCDLANCPPGDPTCQDCNRNSVPDECDIADGTSQDIDGNGVPDDCYPPPIADPGDKNRYVSLSLPPQSVGSGPLTALRVTLVDLQNPVPPNLPLFPPPDFSAYESATCTAPGEASGCARWVGKPGTFLESQDSPGLGSYKAARLQCTPYYHDFAGEGLLHVTGAEIVPSSKYDVQTFASFCTGNESTCTAVSTALRINTARSGDITPPFSPPSPTTQPDALDVAQVVNKLKGLPGAPIKAIAQLQPNLPELNADVNALDIVAVVDAVKQKQYAFGGPCPCPSVVMCGSTGCSTVTPCVTAYGAGALCVKTCSGGDNDGDPCINDTHGHCPGGTCGAGFCRDRCGRCTP